MNDKPLSDAMRRLLARIDDRGYVVTGNTNATALALEKRGLILNTLEMRYIRIWQAKWVRDPAWQKVKP